MEGLRAGIAAVVISSGILVLATCSLCYGRHPRSASNRRQNLLFCKYKPQQSKMKPHSQLNHSEGKGKRVKTGGMTALLAWNA